MKFCVHPKSLAFLLVFLVLTYPGSSFQLPLISTARETKVRLQPPSIPVTPHTQRQNPLYLASGNSEEEIDRQLQRARAVLAVSRAKMEALDDDVGETDDLVTGVDLATPTVKSNGRIIRGNGDALPLASNVPFFATVSRANSNEKKNDYQQNDETYVGSESKKEKVIKSKNKDTGLFTTDGDLMAKLSEEEEWEPRPLLQVFSNERKTTPTQDHLADRDVAASIYGLRKSLQLEDFQKIFDKRNRFIGEP